MNKTDLIRINDNTYEIPQGFVEGMRVPGRVYADETIMDAALGDRAMEQLANTALLPGVTKWALAMPDVHQGYGPPIGGVVPIDEHDGVISPGATGYDINCGVRLLRSDLDIAEVRPYLEELVNALFRLVPSGVGRGGDVKLADEEMAEYFCME